MQSKTNDFKAYVKSVEIYMVKCNVSILNRRKNIILDKTVTKLFTIFIKSSLSYLKPTSYLKEIQYIQRTCIFKKTYLFREMFFYLKKMLIFKKIGTFKENLKFKFQISIIVGFRNVYFISAKKIAAMIKGQLIDSTMVASNERPSKRSTGISFVGLKRIAEELQNIQQKYMTT